MIAAVTGVGLVCHAGVGLANVVTALNTGALMAQAEPPEEQCAELGIKMMSVDDQFSPADFVRKRKDLKLMSPAARLGVAAAKLALDDAGLMLEGQTELGLFVGIGREPGDLDALIGPVAHSLNDQGKVDVELLASQGMRWMNPLSSLKTLPNMTIGHISIQTGARGPNMALCDGPSSGITAIREGAFTLQDGSVPGVLAGAADSRISFQDRLAAKRLGIEETQSECGAFLMLEQVGSARERGAQIWGTVEFSDEFRDSTDTRILGDCGAATTVGALSVAIGLGREFTCKGLKYVPWDGKKAVSRFNIKTAEPKPVGISSVGLVTPLGNDLELFSTRLLSGESAVSRISHFNVDGFPVTNGCECPNQDVFSPHVPQTLLDTFVGLEDRKGELAVRALFRSLADGPTLPTHTPFFYGTGLSSLSLGEVQQDYAPFVRGDAGFDFAAFGDAQPQTAPQAPYRHMVSRPLELVRTHLAWSSEIHTHFSACAASAAAISHGAAAIRRGDTSCAVVGGADSMIHPFGMLPFILLGAASSEKNPDLAGRPFDADRDGFVMGEGAVFFVLENVERIRADGRSPLALIHGWGHSCDAYNVTAPHPRGEGAELAMARALRAAGLPHSEIGYVNAHGTGTPLNDVVEGKALERLFDGAPPPVSSSKAQFGHCLAAAGALEALACIAALRHDRLPPNAHLYEQDPRINLDLVEAQGRAAKPQYILSNSFGFGGQNASLIFGRAEGFS